MAFTYFFRDARTLDLIARHVIPHLRGKRYVDVWDAGCATGAEAFSLAMVLRENMSEFVFRNVRIWATDIDEQFAAIVSRGQYEEEEVKRIPGELLEKYFAPAEETGRVVVAEPLRRAVTFHHHDLTSLEPIREGLCLIVCKNVLLHLRSEQVTPVFKMFRDALDMGGFLVTEQTQKMPARASAWFRRVCPEGQVFQRA